MGFCITWLTFYLFTCHSQERGLCFLVCSSVRLFVNSIVFYTIKVVVHGSMFAWSAGDHGFEPRQSQAKDFKTGIWCFSAKDAALRSKIKDCSARRQNKVFGWCDISSCGRLPCELAARLKIRLSVSV